MTIITLDLPADLYQRLMAEAKQHSTALEAMAEKLLAQQLATEQLSEHERTAEVLREADLLVEPSPAMHRLAAEKDERLFL